VVFFKLASNGEVRVSLRSKYDVDVRKVANGFGGGGHKNAAGFTVTEPLSEARPRIIALLVEAIRHGLQTRPA
jgi:phosphoesterase RecJ-like protein